MMIAHSAGDRPFVTSKFNVENRKKQRFVGGCGRHAFVNFHDVLRINVAVISAGNERTHIQISCENND